MSNSFLRYYFQQRGAAQTILMVDSLRNRRRRGDGSYIEHSVNRKIRFQYTRRDQTITLYSLKFSMVLLCKIITLMVQNNKN